MLAKIQRPSLDATIRLSVIAAEHCHTHLLHDPLVVISITHLWISTLRSIRKRSCRGERVAACLASTALYVGAMHTGRHGRPRMELLATLLLAQVVKSHQGRRLVGVTRRVAFDTRR